MESLKNNIVAFATANRKALEPAEKRLNVFDGEMHEAWELAVNDLSVDWRKIVLIAWLAFDENIIQHDIKVTWLDLNEWSKIQPYFLINIICDGGHSFNRHPNYRLLKSALNEGEKELSKKIQQKQPVSKRARVIHSKLIGFNSLEAMTTPQLLDWLSEKPRNDNIDEKTLRKALDELKPYGLKNKPRIGYYIQK